MKTNINSTKRENKIAEVLAGAAKGFGKVAANSACCYIYHQPKMPDAVKKLKKFYGICS